LVGEWRIQGDRQVTPPKSRDSATGPVRDLVDYDIEDRDKAKVDKVLDGANESVSNPSSEVG
jgi:hypothetical protein